MTAANELSGTIRAHFELLLSRHPALRFVCLCTGDGALLEHESADATLRGARIAAMTSAALALSESFARDALHAACSYSVIYSESGAIVMVRIPLKDRSYTLSVASDGTEVLAATLRTALDTAQRIAAALD